MNGKEQFRCMRCSHAIKTRGEWKFYCTKLKRCTGNIRNAYGGSSAYRVSPTDCPGKAALR